MPSSGTGCPRWLGKRQAPLTVVTFYSQLKPDSVAASILTDDAEAAECWTSYDPFVVGLVNAPRVLLCNLMRDVGMQDAVDGLCKFPNDRITCIRDVRE